MSWVDNAEIYDLVAGRGGFEPPEVLPSPVFKTGTFNRSDISRQCEKEFYPKKIKIYKIGGGATRI